MINQTQVAQRYGVSQQQISSDLDRLGEYVETNLGSRRELTTEAVFHRSIRGLLQNEEYRKAAQTVKDWNEWVDNHKELAELTAKVEKIEERQR